MFRTNKVIKKISSRTSSFPSRRATTSRAENTWKDSQMRFIDWLAILCFPLGLQASQTKNVFNTSAMLRTEASRLNREAICVASELKTSSGGYFTKNLHITWNIVGVKKIMKFKSKLCRSFTGTFEMLAIDIRAANDCLFELLTFDIRAVPPPKLRLPLRLYCAVFTNAERFEDGKSSSTLRLN